MSNHEQQGKPSHQPDQPYSQLDDLTRVRAKMISGGYNSLSADEAALADQFIDALFSPDFPEASLPNLPADFFPPGLSPKLQELWRQEDEARNNMLPPDMPPQ